MCGPSPAVGCREAWTRFGLALEEARVPEHHQVHFRRWVQTWMDQSPTDREGLEVAAFAKRLEAKGTPDWQCRQAFQALQLWLRVNPPQEDEGSPSTPKAEWSDVLKRMEENLVSKRYSRRTVKTYLDWARRCAKGRETPPGDSREASGLVQGFLDHLALVENLAPATLDQCRNALAWLVRKELGFELELSARGSAHHSKRLPSVISPEAVRAILAVCPEPWDLFFGLQYGCGFRLAELLDLRIQDIDDSRGVVVVRSGKGDKDRVVPLPRSLRDRLERHLEARHRLWLDDRQSGCAKVDLPFSLGRKWSDAETSWEWQHVFGSRQPLRYPGTGELRRWRPLEEVVRKALHRAAGQAAVPGRIHPHLLRHCYATHLLERGVPLSEIKELMGHARLETTMIYLHVRAPQESRISPLDRIESRTDSAPAPASYIEG